MSLLRNQTMCWDGFKGRCLWLIATLGGCGFSNLRRFPRVSRASNSLGAGARGLVGDCGAQRMWRRPVASPPAATQSLRLRRAPGQGCFGAWDAARASCLRRGEEQTNLQMQGLQLIQGRYMGKSLVTRPLNFLPGNDVMTL